MPLDTIGLLTSVVLLLSIVLVVLAASIDLRFNRRFTEGVIRALGKFVFLSIMALLGKLLTDFCILVLPSFLQNPTTLMQLFGILGMVFIILTVIFLMKVALLIKEISKKFGFKVD